MAHRQSLRTVLVAATILGAGLLGSGPVWATTLSYAELSYDNALFSNFNLVTLGDLNSSAPSGGYSTGADGRVLVGGNLNIGSANAFSACVAVACPGNMTANVDPTKQAYGALTVFGNVVGASGAYGFTTGYQSNGTAYVQGSVNTTFYANQRGDLSVAGSTTSLTVNAANYVTTASGLTSAQKSGDQSQAHYATASAASAFPFNSGNVTSIGNQVKSLSTGIAKLPGSPGVTTQTLTVGDSVFFTANNDYVANGLKYGVVTTTLANLASETNFKGVNNGTNEATLVIVTGDVMTSGKAGYNANYVLPNLGSYTGSNRVIYDFVDATTLKFAGNWTGSILAPLANITGSSGTFNGTIDGSVIVQSIAMSNALYASNLFIGDLRGLVPEPASMALLGLGAAAAAFVRRRRK